MDQELLGSLSRYGRGHIQALVVRSQEMNDVVSYLQAERMLEMMKVTSFVTTDSVHFERGPAFSFSFENAPDIASTPIYLDYLLWPMALNRGTKICARNGLILDLL